MTLNLYEQADALDEAMRHIDEWIAEHPKEIEEAGGVLPPEVTAEYDELMRKQADSIAWSAKKIQEYDAEQDAIECEMKRLELRVDAIERKRTWRKKMLFDYMLREGKDEVKTPLVTVKIKLNPPRVVAPMWSQLELGELWASPEYDWCVVRKDPTFSLDLNKIKRLASGDVPEGSELRKAFLVPEGIKIVQDKSLSIK